MFGFNQEESRIGGSDGLGGYQERALCHDCYCLEEIGM